MEHVSHLWDFSIHNVLKVQVLHFKRIRRIHVNKLKS